MPGIVGCALLVLDNLVLTKPPGGRCCLTTNLLIEKSNHRELKTCPIPTATQSQSQVATQVAELGVKPRWFGLRSHILLIFLCFFFF